MNKYLALLSFLGIAFTSCTKQENSKPNVIYIMADDLGYGDIGVYGQKTIQTPNIDKLASQGMLFTQHYAGNTVCAPSRCVLMTAKHVGHARIRGNADVPLLDEDLTVAEVMKNAGYTTGLIGKWGLGDEGSTGTPNKQGFDYFYGYLNQVHAHNYYPEFLWENDKKDTLGNIVELASNKYSRFVGGHSTNKKTYSHNKFIDKTMHFLEENKDKPFFLYLPYTLPHANNEAPAFGDNGMEIPDFGIYKDKDWPDAQKGHAAMITELDRTVGLIMEKLKAEGIEDNTILIFTSDNGPLNEGGALADYFDSNGTLRGTKRDLYEAGIRVPMIVRWPGKINPGSKTDHASGFVDLLPTLAELSGQTLTEKTDGVSYLPSLLGQKQPKHDFLYWEFYEQGGKTGILKDNWKCIQLQINDSTKTTVELYNLSDDLGEEKNLVTEFPEKAAELLAIMKVEHQYSPDFNFEWERK